jgi:hypothetical protein
LKEIRDRIQNHALHDSTVPGHINMCPCASWPRSASALSARPGSAGDVAVPETTATVVRARKTTTAGPTLPEKRAAMETCNAFRRRSPRQGAFTSALKDQATVAGGTGRPSDPTARLFGSYPDPGRAAFTTDPVFIFDLLQQDPNALGFVQGRAATTSRSTNWDHYRRAGSIWIASPLRADMIFGKDRHGR